MRADQRTGSLRRARLHADGRDLDVAVDVEAVVLAGQHNGPVVHQRHVETLGVLHLQLNNHSDQILAHPIVSYGEILGKFLLKL